MFIVKIWYKMFWSYCLSNFFSINFYLSRPTASLFQGWIVQFFWLKTYSAIITFLLKIFDCLIVHCFCDSMFIKYILNRRTVAENLNNFILPTKKSKFARFQFFFVCHLETRLYKLKIISYHTHYVMLLDLTLW